MHATRPEPATTPPHASLDARRVLVLRTEIARRRRNVLIVVAVTLAAAAAVAAGLTVWGVRAPFLRTASDGAGPVERLVMPTKAADLSIILDTDVMPLTADDARALNEKRAVDVTQVMPARPFHVSAGADEATQFDAALKCLAQAVYYEAASEPETGQRAVAQVVLNRVKHPAFPNTICGVVYQGSQRVTGCQFTFTCDGSLARVPLSALYRRAERIARDALSGRVAREVGNSTNYHADYVVPYWAPSLAKLTQIGRHIFYGLRGAIGSGSAFRMPYDLSLETTPGLVPPPLPLPSPTENVMPGPLSSLPGALPLPQASQLQADKISGALIPGGAPPAVEAEAPSLLRADQDRGQLVDQGMRLDDEASERR